MLALLSATRENIPKGAIVATGCSTAMKSLKSCEEPQHLADVKKHIKQGQGHEGGVFTVEAPLHVSNVQVLDPATRKPCKVGIKYLEDGSKVRVSQGLGASGSIIPRSKILKIRTTPRPTIGMVKKHIKQWQGHEGGIFTVEAPFHVSNVQVLDPATGKPCKVGIKYLEDGSKVRVSRGLGVSGSIIPRPEILKIRTTQRPTIGMVLTFCILYPYIC
ncbi:hypothetical protein Syun_007551 [Stephania yunnanensis]|uniref:Large ribosomal subunit protein uL24 C-terminal domain-containing protein n=1 Tax=Stephania yunnanensis TaxID=152371 RepID=A0AAP0KZQ6_9MAGN